MSMIFSNRTCTCLLAATLTLGSASALAEVCYSGGNSDGTLEFRGSVEGSGFTGSFGEFDVRYCMEAGQPVSGRIEVRVALASADSNNRDRDEALLGEEFFDVARFDHSTWTSTSIEADGDGYRAEGELTLRDVTAPQPIDFVLAPDGDALRARGQFSMSGAANVDRQTFNVGTGEFADPEFVRNRVDVEFDVALAAETE